MSHGVARVSKATAHPWSAGVPARPAWRRTTGQEGFTLIEVGVVLFIVVLLVGIAIPTIRTVNSMQVQTDISKLASNIRAARGHAAVAGETCRMLFNIGGGSYSLECTSGLATVGKEAARNGEAQEVKQEHRQSETVEQQKVRQELQKKHAFTASKVLPSQSFRNNLQFVSVWTPHQQEAYTKGKAYMYFFPSGSSETANIVLQYGDEFYTVQVASIAGNVRIIGEKAKLAEQEDWD
jgi:general secretion pathway protein H